MDDYLLPRLERAKLEVSGYDPAANKMYLILENLTDLSEGRSIVKPRYNHSTGETTTGEKIEPRPLIIVEGVTTLYAEIRDLSKISFFLDAQEETQIKSRIERDVNQRGYTLDEALALYENLKPDYERHIAPTKAFASVIFRVSPDYVMHPISINEEFKGLL